jgi:hypothetical protein
MATSSRKKSQELSIIDQVFAAKNYVLLSTRPIWKLHHDFYLDGPDEKFNADAITQLSLLGKHSETKQGHSFVFTHSVTKEVYATLERNNIPYYDNLGSILRINNYDDENVMIYGHINAKEIPLLKTFNAQYVERPINGGSGIFLIRNEDADSFMRALEEERILYSVSEKVVKPVKPGLKNPIEGLSKPKISRRGVYREEPVSPLEEKKKQKLPTRTFEVQTRAKGKEVKYEVERIPTLTINARAKKSFIELAGIPGYFNKESYDALNEIAQKPETDEFAHKYYFKFALETKSQVENILSRFNVPYYNMTTPLYFDVYGNDYVIVRGDIKSSHSMLYSFRPILEKFPSDGGSAGYLLGNDDFDSYVELIERYNLERQQIGDQRGGIKYTMSRRLKFGEPLEKASSPVRGGSMRRISSPERAVSPMRGASLRRVSVGGAPLTRVSSVERPLSPVRGALLRRVSSVERPVSPVRGASMRRLQFEEAPVSPVRRASVRGEGPLTRVSSVERAVSPARGASPVRGVSMRRRTLSPPREMFS